tara:strand:+ start:3496 stop:4383 length:888 start_codon:yes stop_codon:yes gene_type:complete
MKNTKIKLILSAIMLTQIIMPVQAESREQKIYERCNEESLDNYKAHGRLKWGLRCELIPEAYYYNAINSRYYPRVWYPIASRQNPITLLNEYATMPTNENDPCEKIGNYKLGGQCLSSCYTPDQELLFAEGEMTIYDAFTNKVQKIVTLSDDATFEQLGKTERDIFAWVVSIKDTEHDILVIQTEQGQLKVTPNHPLVLSNGKMMTAGTLQVGQSLIREDGDFAEIISIDEIKYHGKVYNVEPDAKDENGQQSMNGHILIAQGFLSGSNFYQNSDEAKYMNQYLLRHQIPDTLLN